MKKEFGFILFGLFLMTGCALLGTGGSAGEELVYGETTTFEMEILAEVNLVRSNPKSYFDKYIAPQQSKFSSQYFESCKADMNSTANLGSLSYNETLYRIAKAHVVTQGKTNKTGHDRTNGKSFGDTIKGYGTFSYAGENISYGVSTARGIVIQLLVDDGVPSLGHRINMLTTNYDSVGVAFGSHGYYRVMCVMDFAKEWKDK